MHILDSVSLKSALKRNLLLLFMVAGFLLSIFHFHIEEGLNQHSTCSVCHHQGTIASFTTAISFTPDSILYSSIYSFDEKITQTDSKLSNDSRAPPLILV
ncbi:hypothetical protein HOH45_06080 [bacterium]|jgi:hypothetical protein|nr:hypothetical protein [bacterium]